MSSSDPHREVEPTRGHDIGLRRISDLARDLASEPPVQMARDFANSSVVRMARDLEKSQTVRAARD